MNIKETFTGDVAVLALKGNLMGEPETSEFRGRIKELVEEGFIKIVLDVGKLKWVNSSGLGAMISAMTTINNAGGDMRIANVTEKIKSLFMITQLVKVFKSYETSERAVASFTANPIAGKKTE